MHRRVLVDAHSFYGVLSARKRLFVARGNLLIFSFVRGPEKGSTEDPMWGYPVFVLGAISSFLEPFYGHLSPKLDKLCSKLTFEIPPRRALRGVHIQPSVAIMRRMT